MKTTKILMGVAAACAMAVAVMGCKNASEEVGEKYMIDYVKTKNSTTNAEVTASISYTNNETTVKRGMRFFDNNKKGIVVKLQIRNLTKNSADNPGLVGIVFDRTKNADGTFNFVLVGLKNANGKLESSGTDNTVGVARFYCTYYKNIPEANFESPNFGASATATGNDPFCKDLVDWKDFSNVKILDDGTLNLGVCIKALKKTEWTALADEYDDVSDTVAYEIYLRNADDVDVTKLGKTTTQNSAELAAQLLKFTISHDDIDAKPNKLVENGLGFYANVYAGQTLSGEWQVADIKHNPNVSKSAAEDAQDNPLNIQIVY